MKEFKTLKEAGEAYAALSKENESLKSENKALKEANETAIKAAEELSSRLASAEEKIESDTIAKVGGKKYRVNFGVSGKSKAELADDAELLKKLVTSGSGAITEVK